MSAFEPSGRIGRPVVTKCRRPPFQSGSTDSNAGVCGRKPSLAAGSTSTRSVTRPCVSIAVPQTSPSPCAKCTSPSESSAPGDVDRAGRPSRPRAPAGRRGCRPSRAAGSCAAPSTRRARRPGTAAPGSGGSANAARLGERRLARAEALQPLVRRRDADHADERIGRDAHALQPARRRDPVVQSPGHEVRLLEEVAEQPEAGDDRGRAEAVGLDREDLDLEHVAGLGAAHGDRARQRVAAVAGRASARSASSVAGVICPSRPSRQSTTISSPGSTSSAGRQVRVPAVVARLGRVGERAPDGRLQLMPRHRASPRSRSRRLGSGPRSASPKLARRAQVVDREQRDQLAVAVAAGHDLGAHPAVALAHLVERRRRPGTPPPRPPARPARRCSASTRGTGCLRQVRRVVAQAAGARRERLVAHREHGAGHVDAHRDALHAELGQQLLDQLLDGRAHSSAPPVVSATAE